MILPDFWAMSRPAAARQPLKTPTRLTSMVRRNSSGAIAAKGRTPAVPASLTRMSRRPRPWTARSTRASTCSYAVTSGGSITALRPSVPTPRAAEDRWMLDEHGRLDGQDALLARELGQLLGIEGDEGHRIGPAVAVDHGLADEGIGLEQVLDVLRGDVHAARRHDEVLLAVRDEEIAVLVEAADVPGGEPPVVQEHFTSRFGLLEVALGDIAAPAQDLPVGRDLDLHARHGLAHRAELEGILAIVRQHRTRLRESIPFEDEDARGMEELGDVAREGRATRDGEPQAAAESCVHLREHQLVGDGVLHAQPGGDGAPRLLEPGDLLAHAHRPPEDLPLDG